MAIVIERNALAQFLDTVPKMVWDAKLAKSQLEHDADQKQLDREWQLKSENTNFKRDLVRDLWTRKQELSDSLDQLGLISDATSTLNEIDVSGNAETFVNQVENAYKGGDEELDAMLSDLQGQITSDRYKLSSYNKGKSFFNKVDVNSDGSIPEEELNEFVLNNADTFNLWDKDAFIQGLHASELDPLAKTEMRLKQAATYDAELRNKYLESTLVSDEKQRALQLDLTELQKEQLHNTLTMQGVELDAARTNLALGKLNLENLQTEVAQNRFNYDQVRDTSVKASIESNKQLFIDESKTLASSIIQSIKLTNKDGNKILPLWNIIKDKAEGDSNKFLSEFEDLDTLLGKNDYIDQFEFFATALGYENEGSILPDLKGIINAITIGWNNETGQLDVVEPLLTNMVEINNEMSQFYETNIGKNVDVIIEMFDRESPEDIWNDPAGFANWYKSMEVDDYLDMKKLMGIDDFTDEDIIKIFRYAQFKQVGILDEDYLELINSTMDDINESDTLLKALNNKTIDLGTFR